MESFFKKSIISKENKKKSDSRGKEKKYFSRPTPVNKGKKVSSVKKTSLTPKKKRKKNVLSKKTKIVRPKIKKNAVYKKNPVYKRNRSKKTTRLNKRKNIVYKKCFKRIFDSMRDKKNCSKINRQKKKHCFFKKKDPRNHPNSCEKKRYKKLSDST